MDIETGTEKLKARIEGGILWITLSNPERHNAVTLDMVHASGVLLNQAADDDDIAVVVVRGEGDRAYASGADLSESPDIKLGGLTPAEVKERAWTVWESFPKPIISMISGYCLGGGLVLSLRTDLRICSEGSQFGIPATKLGRAYSFDGTKKLVDVVGKTWASYILLTSRRLSAQDALEAGLVTHVLPPGELEAFTRELAADIAVNAPLSMRVSKIAIGQAVLSETERDHDVLEEAIRVCLASKDAKEGRLAFLEKRAPQWRGE